MPSLTRRRFSRLVLDGKGRWILGKPYVLSGYEFVEVNLT